MLCCVLLCNVVLLALPRIILHCDVLFVLCYVVMLCCIVL